MNFLWHYDFFIWWCIIDAFNKFGHFIKVKNLELVWLQFIKKILHWELKDSFSGDSYAPASYLVTESPFEDDLNDGIVKHFHSYFVSIKLSSLIAFYNLHYNILHDLFIIDLS